MRLALGRSDAGASNGQWRHVLRSILLGALLHSTVLDSICVWLSPGGGDGVGASVGAVLGRAVGCIGLGLRQADGGGCILLGRIQQQLYAFHMLLLGRHIECCISLKLQSFEYR
jgi:quinol-cytochrome oxidoreductase complex cytochrome b subunit